MKHLISINLLKESCQKNIIVRQRDTSAHTIIINLAEGTNPFKFPENSHAVMCGIKPDGKKICNDCEIINNQIIYKVTPQTISCSGVVECQVHVTTPLQEFAVPKFLIIVEDIYAAPHFELLDNEPDNWVDYADTYYKYDDITKEYSPVEFDSERDLLADITFAADPSKEGYYTSQRIPINEGQKICISKKDAKIIKAYVTLCYCGENGNVIDSVTNSGDISTGKTFTYTAPTISKRDRVEKGYSYLIVYISIPESSINNNKAVDIMVEYDYKTYFGCKTPYFEKGKYYALVDGTSNSKDEYNAILEALRKAQEYSRKGIKSITTVNDCIVITYQDNSKYISPNLKGVGIISIEQTAKINNIDYYTITLSDNTTYEFSVTNCDNEVLLKLRNDSHSHNNKSILDSIKQSDIDYWNSKVNSENLILPLYNLTEDEFWQKYNSGELGTGLYECEGETCGFEDIVNDFPINSQSIVLEQEDKTYIVTCMSYENQALSIIDKEGNLIQTCNPTDILPDNWNILFIAAPYANISKSFIGVDDQGYIYINASGNNEACSYSYGVVSVNTSDICNPDSWSWIDGITDTHLLFAPCNISNYNNDSGLYETPNYLKTADGGTFAISIPWGVWMNREWWTNRNSCSYSSEVKAWYLKGGQNMWSEGIQFISSPNTLTVDKDRNMLFGLDGHYHGYSEGMEIRGIDKDKNETRYGEISLYFELGNRYGHTDLKSDKEYGNSILYCKNNKVFFSNANSSTPYCAVLNLETQNVDNITFLRRRTEDGSNFDYSYFDHIEYVSNVLDDGKTMSFIVHTNDYCVNFLVTWNYADNKILVTDIGYADGDLTSQFLEDSTGNIMLSVVKSYSIGAENKASLIGVSPITHDIAYTYTTPFSHWNFNCFTETSDGDKLIFGYIFDPLNGSQNTFIKIDINGNIIQNTILASPYISNDCRPVEDENCVFLWDSGSIDVVFDKKHKAVLPGYKFSHIWGFPLRGKTIGVSVAYEEDWNSHFITKNPLARKKYSLSCLSSKNNILLSKIYQEE